MKWLTNKPDTSFTCRGVVTTGNKILFSNHVFEELSLQKSRAVRFGYSGVGSDKHVIDVIVQRIALHDVYQQKGIATRVLVSLSRLNAKVPPKPNRFYSHPTSAPHFYCGVHLQQCITPESKALANALVRDHFWYYQHAALVDGDVNVFSPVGPKKLYTNELNCTPELNKRMRLYDAVTVKVDRLKWEAHKLHTYTCHNDTPTGKKDPKLTLNPWYALTDYIRRKRQHTGNFGIHIGNFELIEMKIVDLQPHCKRGLLVAPTELLNHPSFQFTLDTFEVEFHDVESKKKAEVVLSAARREWKLHHQAESNKCNYEASFLPTVIARVTRAIDRELTDREIRLVEGVRQALQSEWNDRKPLAKKRKMSDEEVIQQIEKEGKEGLESKRLDEKYHLKSIEPGENNRHELAVYMLMWARIAGIKFWTEDTDNHNHDTVLMTKYIDLTICFGMNADDKANVEEKANQHMGMGTQMYRVMSHMSKTLLDRLEQFHIEYMNISEEATNGFMEQYRIYFDQTMKYEMIIWTRLQELKPNFITEEDEDHYNEVLEMFNVGEAEWRVRASKDVRVVAVQKEIDRVAECSSSSSTKHVKAKRVKKDNDLYKKLDEQKTILENRAVHIVQDMKKKIAERFGKKVGQINLDGPEYEKDYPEYNVDTFTFASEMCGGHPAYEVLTFDEPADNFFITSIKAEVADICVQIHELDKKMNQITDKPKWFLTPKQMREFQPTINSLKKKA